MRLLRIICSVDPNDGGVVEAVRLSSESLAERGHTTEVVSMDAPSAPYVREFPFKVHACGPGIGKYAYGPRLERWIEQNAQRFDAAIIEGIWNHASIAGWRGLRRQRLPFFIFVHGMMDPWFRKAMPVKHWAKQLFWLLWQGRALRDAEAVLFTCEEERRLSRGVFWGYSYREQVVAFGTSAPPPVSKEETASSKARLPNLGERPYLLFLSRIHPKKGCDILIDAFESIASNYPEIDLVIAGPDQVGWKDELLKKSKTAGIAARIHWPGMLTGEAKWNALRNAEALVLPSHQENFGIVVTEAMSCGVPVLITSKVNIWREVEKYSAGIVEEDNLTGVTGLLAKWLLLAPEDRLSMKSGARQCFAECFTAKAAADHLECLLKKLPALQPKSKTTD